MLKKVSLFFLLKIIGSYVHYLEVQQNQINYADFILEPTPITSQPLQVRFLKHYMSFIIMSDALIFGIYL